MSTTVNDFIGIPYEQLDCYQLLRLASKKLFNRDLPDIQDYVADPREAVEVHSASKGWKRLEKREVGCVVVLGQSPTYAKHVGLCLANGVLHTCRKYGAIIQDDYQLLAAGYMDQRFYRWEG